MAYLRVRELAEERGFNITTLSRKAELAYTTTHNLWHGNAAQLNIRTLERVARALDVRVGDLFGEESERDTQEQSGNKYSPALLAA
jgi:DNA-binding Xre family transcriptional regulator